MKNHNGHDKRSHLVKHSIESGHDPVCHGNFRILDKGYNNTVKSKVAEALLIKKHKPSLNVQEKSVNWNFSINNITYSCVTIRAATNRTRKMEHIATMVNSLSH